MEKEGWSTMGLNCMKMMGIPTFAERPDAEYLFFPGCNPFADRSKGEWNMVCMQLLRDRKIDFAVLGKEQWCCGDKACQLGYGELSGLISQRNITAWQELKIKKIVTSCPRCFYNFQHKYRRYGGNFEVILLSRPCDEKLSIQTLQEGVW